MSLYGVLRNSSPEQSSEPERAIDARGESCSRVLRHRAFARRGCCCCCCYSMWLHPGPRFCAAGSPACSSPPRDIQVERAHDLRKLVS